MGRLCRLMAENLLVYGDNAIYRDRGIAKVNADPYLVQHKWTVEQKIHAEQQSGYASTESGTPSDSLSPSSAIIQVNHAKTPSPFPARSS